LQALQGALDRAFEQFENVNLVCYNAGVDIHKDDNLGKMALTDAGILSRDRMVFRQCAERGIPVAAAIGGGYSEDHEKLVGRHVLLHRAAAEHFNVMNEKCSRMAKRQAARLARS
jgi:acetoin utilization deacetylase AcuC-like enzyme